MSFKAKLIRKPNWYSSLTEGKFYTVYNVLHFTDSDKEEYYITDDNGFETKVFSECFEKVKECKIDDIYREIDCLEHAILSQTRGIFNELKLETANYYAIANKVDFLKKYVDQLLKLRETKVVFLNKEVKP